tara:strand:+ start:629 stop:880 length:252 start_codon:yes stop_codon:yes gene_type:complete
MSRHDLDKYMPLVDAFDISDDHKRELLKSVWRIAQNFVDRAYGIDSTQISVENRDADSGKKCPDSVYLKAPQENKTNLQGGPR